jgi:hypothetical protein
VPARAGWVPETLLTSCDLLILVEQSAGPVPPLDAFGPACRVLGDWPYGSAEGVVRPVPRVPAVATCIGSGAPSRAAPA